MTVMEDPLAAVVHAAEEGYELIIINLDIENVDGLRLCSQLKSLERTRQTPILIIIDADDIYGDGVNVAAPARRASEGWQVPFQRLCYNKVALERLRCGRRCANWGIHQE